MKNIDPENIQPDDWEDGFRQRFADFRANPPDHALNRILTDLQARKPAPGFRYGRLLIGVSLLALLTGSWFLSRSFEPGPIPIATSASRVSSLLLTPNHTPANQPMKGLSQQRKTKAAQPVEQNNESIRPIILLDPNDRTAPTATPTLVRLGSRPKSTEPPIHAVLPQREAGAGLVSINPSFAAQTAIPLEKQAHWTNPSEPVEDLRSRPFRGYGKVHFPTIQAPVADEAAPQQPVVSRQRPISFVSFMPLYLYQRINPIQNDGVLVRDLSTQHALSTERVGVRIQAGVEWPLSKKVSLRTSLAYNHLSQQVTYTTRNPTPDSVRVERIDEKTVRVTPFYSDKRVETRANWHFVGVGTELVWRVGSLGAWRHYTTMGTTVGLMIGPAQTRTGHPVSGFVQAAYGIERAIGGSLWLRVAPTVQYGLNTLSDRESLFRIRPYTYGLTVGLRR
ncbi:hypothetical protein F5984_15700 [Rudanella paleaurantiibacter]|uniref:Uncharacterized protein n=1 Tax=Rudanella paleaurantiibacter TaxID=2614655 RepID=A0A7J5TWT0_9BACT|nr:hypothetical protein [Rudanella paleaurantiibacter]KAB7729092.1 hypothetical protein F5984_15700 [Rudanella paleaurantiibacter]